MTVTAHLLCARPQGRHGPSKVSRPKFPPRRGSSSKAARACQRGLCPDGRVCGHADRVFVHVVHGTTRASRMEMGDAEQEPRFSRLAGGGGEKKDSGLLSLIPRRFARSASLPLPRFSVPPVPCPLVSCFCDSGARGSSLSLPFTQHLLCVRRRRAFFIALHSGLTAILL